MAPRSWINKKYTAGNAAGPWIQGGCLQRAVVAALATIDLSGPVKRHLRLCGPHQVQHREITRCPEKAQAWVTQGKEIEAAISQAFDSPAERLRSLQAMSTAIPDLRMRVRL